MPELPEAERARQQIERALGREIVAVDDRDTYVCRPHAPGEIAAALTGRRLTRAHRRGKFLWVETDDGPDLGLHLGMAGRIAVDEEEAPRQLGPLRARVRRRRPDGAARQAAARPRGDRPGLLPRRPGRRRGRPRRLPRPRRPRLDGAEGAAARPGRDRRASATCSPTRRCGARGSRRCGSRASCRSRSSTCCAASCARRSATRSATAASTPAASCPRASAAASARADETPLERDTVGGRTTYWCPTCQR